MRERYGNMTAQRLADIDWIRDATSADEVLLTGDKTISKRPIEARTVIETGARVFALGSSRLTGQEKASRFLGHERAIFRHAAQSGPYVLSVTGHGLLTPKLFGG